MEQINNALRALMADDAACQVTLYDDISPSETVTTVTFAHSGSLFHGLRMDLRLTYFFQSQNESAPKSFNITGTESLISQVTAPALREKKPEDMPHKLAFSLRNGLQNKYASAHFLRQGLGGQMCLEQSYLNGGIFASIGDDSIVQGNLSNIEGRTYQQATAITSSTLRDTTFNLRDPVDYAYFLRAAYERFKVVRPKIWLHGAHAKI